MENRFFQVFLFTFFSKLKPICARECGFIFKIRIQHLSVYRTDSIQIWVRNPGENPKNPFLRRINGLQATTGSGGWPLSVFLTPGLKPVYGGTYFPPTPAYGRPSFTQILEALAKQWRDDQVQLGLGNSLGHSCRSMMYNFPPPPPTAAHPSPRSWRRSPSSGVMIRYS